MPRLSGYRERLTHNVYDSFSPWQWARCDGDIARHPTWNLKLFGGLNVGNTIRSNLLIAGQPAGGDQTFQICNWYARLNISGPAVDQWAHVTQLSFGMGSMPIAQLSLWDLMQNAPRSQRESGQPAHLHPRLTGVSETVSTLWLAGQISERLSETDIRLNAAQWSLIAHEARRIGAAPFINVPERQTVFVSVETDVRALRHMVETTQPASPESLVWIHLDGIAARHIY